MIVVRTLAAGPFGARVFGARVPAWAVHSRFVAGVGFPRLRKHGDRLGLGRFERQEPLMRNVDVDVVESLEHDILFGRLQPRERLVEDDIIARLAVTRHQVRQALVELEKRGLVVRIANRGAHVRDFDEEEIRQIGDVREYLHAKAASLLPLPLDPVRLAALHEAQRAHAAAVGARDLMAIHRTNTQFHGLLFAACGNDYLAQTIADYAALSLAFRCHLMARPIYAERAVREHRAMIEAIERQDRDALVALCVEHTRPAEQVYRAIRGWSADTREPISPLS